MDDNDLLTLEIRVKREGVLDRDAALGLIEQVRGLLDDYDRGYDAGHTQGYHDGFQACENAA